MAIRGQRDCFGVQPVCVGWYSLGKGKHKVTKCQSNQLKDLAKPSAVNPFRCGSSQT